MKSLLLFFVLLPIVSSAQQTVGLFNRDPASQDGYVLFAPSASTRTYLIDKCGKEVHSWNSTHKPALSVYLLPDGTLLRPGGLSNAGFPAGGSGGVIEKFDWNSNLLWSYTISSATECQHHDVCPLPNGNILTIVWESKTSADALNAGRNPSILGTSLWSEKIVELQPTGTNTANIVWEWHVWDHLIQDYDNTKPGYGVVSQHPELIDLNYIGGPATSSDWLHGNGLSYNSTLDQIILSIHNTSEFWIIDHSTTTAQAASHTGGTHNKGGDLLYRWGNPAAYGRGTASTQQLYKQHNAHWIEAGLPDAANIMIFNNGLGRPQGSYSTVEIISPPVNSSGDYSITSSQAFLPDSAYWKYQAPVATDFYAMNISGAQRLSSGNTLICEGTTGRFFEIDPAKNMVWKYVNPVTTTGPLAQGATATQNTVFQCTQYAFSYSGFAGHTLNPGSPIELNPLSYNCTMSTTGVSDIETKEPTITVVNPFSETLYITSSADQKNVSITLYNTLGLACASWTTTLPSRIQTKLNLHQSLPSGIYQLQLQTQTTNTSVKLVH